MKFVHLALLGLVSGIKINTGNSTDPSGVYTDVVIQPQANPKVPEARLTPEELELKTKEAWEAFNQTVKAHKDLLEAHGGSYEDKENGFQKKTLAQNETESTVKKTPVIQTVPNKDAPVDSRSFEVREQEAWTKFNVTVQENKKIVEAHEAKFGYPKKQHLANPLNQTEAVEEEPETKTAEEQKEVAAWKAFNVTVNSIKKIQQAHEDKFGYPKKSLAQNGTAPVDENGQTYKERQDAAWTAHDQKVKDHKAYLDSKDESYKKKSLAQNSTAPVDENGQTYEERQTANWEAFHDRVQEAKDHIEKHYGSYDHSNDNGFKQKKTLAQK